MVTPGAGHPPSDATVLISILYFIICQYKHHLSTDQIDLELGSHHSRIYLIAFATVD